MIALWNKRTEAGQMVFGHTDDKRYQDERAGEIELNDSDKLASQRRVFAIGNGATNIPRAAFARCTQLTTLTVEALNPVYTSLDGVLFNKSRTTLLQYPEGRVGNYAVPSEVTTIGGSAFSGCFALTDLVIPDTVTAIEPHAFHGYTGLTNAAIGNRVAHIGELAFCLCVNLHSVAVPDTVTSISNYLFEDCYSLANVRFGNAVASIGRGALA
jgi:hypothetical protein